VTVTEYIREFERDWLGVIASHPRSRIEQCDWQSDQIEAEYCPRCGQAVGTGEYDGKCCGSCRSRRFPWKHIVRLGSYRDDLRLWIHEIKFRKSDHLAVELGCRLGQALIETDLIDKQQKQTYLVPVPMTWRRRMYRGIDHTTAIARGVSKETGLPILHALTRKSRPMQRSVAPTKRRDNVRHAFQLRRFHTIKDAHLIIVDDVMTSGSTLIEVARTLHRGGASTIHAAVLAAVDSRKQQPKGEQQGKLH